MILFTKKSEEHDSYRDRFRKYSQRSSLAGNERVKFTYLYQETQQEFVRALTKGKQKTGQEELMVNETAKI